MGDIKAFADGLNLLEEGLRLQAKSIGKTLDDSSVTQSEHGARPRDGGIHVEDFTLTLSLDVKARWIKGYPGSRTDQPEPAGYEIQKVFCKSKDITSLLSDDDIDRLMEALDD